MSKKKKEQFEKIAEGKRQEELLRLKREDTRNKLDTASKTVTLAGSIATLVKVVIPLVRKAIFKI